jgi:hypothetical protein
MFDDEWDAYSMSMGARWSCFSRLAILRWWNEHKNFCKTKPKSMRQSFCMPHPMSLYHSISRPYGPNKQCLMDDMPIQCPWKPDWVDFLNVGCKKLDYIFCSTPSKNPWDRPSACPNQYPSTQHFPSIWTQQTMFDDGWDAYSMSMGARWSCFSRLAILRWWKEHQNFCKTKPKSMRQTFCIPHPMSLFHSVSHPYGPNKQCLMDEMRIQCPWEPHHVDYSNVGCKNLDCVCSTPS